MLTLFATSVTGGSDCDHDYADGFSAVVAVEVVMVMFVTVAMTLTF